MKNNLTKRFAMMIVLGVMLLAPISAIAVSIPHMEEIEGVKTYEFYKDNVEDFKVVLQTSGTNPINVQVEVLEGFNVIELMDEDVFLVNPGEKVPVKFRIVSPPGANVGDSFYVRLNFKSSEVGEGALAFGSAVEQRFNVLLVEMPVDTSMTEETGNAGKVAVIIFAVIIGVLILVIIALQIKKGKKEKEVIKPVKKKTVAKKKAPAKKK